MRIEDSRRASGHILFKSHIVSELIRVVLTIGQEFMLGIEHNAVNLLNLCKVDYRVGERVRYSQKIDSLGLLAAHTAQQQSNIMSVATIVYFSYLLLY